MIQYDSFDEQVKAHFSGSYGSFVLMLTTFSTVYSGFPAETLQHWMEALPPLPSRAKASRLRAFQMRPLLRASCP